MMQETHAFRNPKVQKRPIVHPTTQSQPVSPSSGGMVGFCCGSFGGKRLWAFSSSGIFLWMFPEPTDAGEDMMYL